MIGWRSDTLPAVFGSVRAYYDSMSLDRAAGETKGKFQVHAQLINADDGNGYPRWIQLPHTKEYYVGGRRRVRGGGGA